MNVHKNARTTPRSRALTVHRVMHEHSSVSDVASALSVSRRTVCKWLARHCTEGLQGLGDRSSIAHCRPHALALLRQLCLDDRLLAYAAMQHQALGPSREAQEL